MIKNTGINKNIIADSTDKYYSIEAIKEQGLQKRNKSILTADTLKPGFYMNFSEFVNNNPSFLYINDTALHKLLEVMHYRVGKTISNEAPDTSYWGYCDSKNLYIRNGYNYYQLERKDAGFYVAPTLDAMRRNVNRAGWNLLDKSIELGGFSAIQPPDIPMIVIPMQGAYILGLQLDWDTGKITY